MNIAGNSVPLTMTRASLGDLPEFALPSGFTLRWYQPGDEAHWLGIHLSADKLNEITPELFQKQFGWEAERGLQSASPPEHRSGPKSALHELGQRQCYLRTPTGKVVGTGTAWFNDHFAGAPWGRVHWMAVLPAYQGRGLGKVLMSVICRRLRELGHQRAYLTTSTARVPAVGLYLKFGFEPLIRSDEDDRAWREVMRLVKP